MGHPVIFEADNTFVASPYEDQTGSVYYSPYVWLDDRLIGVETYGNDEAVQVTSLYLRGQVGGAWDFTSRAFDSPLIRLVTIEGDFAYALVKAGRVIMGIGYDNGQVWRVTFELDGSVASSEVLDIEPFLLVEGGASIRAWDLNVFVASNDRPEVQGMADGQATGLFQIPEASGDLARLTDGPAGKWIKPAYSGLLWTDTAEE